MRGRGALALIIVGALARPALADDREAAERYFHAGEEAYQAQNFEAAARDFAAAYDALPLPEIAFSAAQAFRRQYGIDPRLEYVRRAVELYRVYLKAVKSGGRVGAASDALEAMDRELDRLIRAGAKVSPALAAEHTQLGVSVDFGDPRSGVHEVDDQARPARPTVRVTLDGVAVEPFTPINVTPGAHTIRVAAAGYLPVELTKTIVQGTSSMIEVPLAPEPARLAIATEATATVMVDGRVVGRAPVAPVALPAGKHVITILHRGRAAYAREVVVAKGERRELTAPLEPSGQRRAVPWLLTASAGVGALALGAGLGAWYYQHQALDARDVLRAGNASQDALDRYDEARARRDQLGTTSWVLVGAAVATSAVALGLYYFDNPIPDEETRRVQLTPTAFDHGAGAAIAGRF